MLHPLDFFIVLLLLGSVLGLAWYTRRFTRSLADFLSANRCVGRYMLVIADSISGQGAISIVASRKQFSNTASPPCTGVGRSRR